MVGGVGARADQVAADDEALDLVGALEDLQWTVSVDNAKPESRPDVLTCTTDPLTAPLEILGAPVVELAPTRSGHRIRLLTAGGSHPRYARNEGTGEPPGTGRELRPCTHTAHHDRGAVSRLLLPTPSG
ncbi:hypothetical protein ABZ313_34100 [Streptomyces sp. NPDC006251]|uniref:hypothetical protein n=1 Tax=Streptomyces sp. NPDC006251 TaxID=3155718 RepID=UPI0033AE365F